MKDRGGEFDDPFKYRVEKARITVQKTFARDPRTNAKRDAVPFLCRVMHSLLDETGQCGGTVLGPLPFATQLTTGKELGAEILIKIARVS